VSATARSPGIAFAGSVAHTTLIETPLLPAGDASDATLRSVVDDPGTALELLVAAGAVSVTPGTLLRLSTADLQSSVVAGDVQAAGGGATQVRSHQWYLARAHVSSPPEVDVLRSETFEILDPALLDLTPSSPWSIAAPRVDALNLEISIWRNR